jgi:hypothetical protein
VSTIELPWTLHTKVIPGRSRKRIRALFGRTTCPLLDSFVVIPYRLTPSTVSQVCLCPTPPACHEACGRASCACTRHDRRPNWQHGWFGGVFILLPTVLLREIAARFDEHAR